MVAYDALASVYDWLVPDELLTPSGAFGAFAHMIDPMPPGARVLDCACGTGQLAVGLALHGFEVVASDLSGAMVQRTRDLAADHGASLHAVRCAWAEMPANLPGPFDAVFCVGNSLTHAEGATGRTAALAAMATVLTPGGHLNVTSRNWERLRALDPGIDVADTLTPRAGRTGLAVRSWTLPDAWEAPHQLEVAVAELDGLRVVGVVSERLTFWPFTYEQLTAELRAAGLEVIGTSYARDADRYGVVARRGGQPAVDPPD